MRHMQHALARLLERPTAPRTDMHREQPGPGDVCGDLCQSRREDCRWEG